MTRMVSMAALAALVACSGGDKDKKNEAAAGEAPPESTPSVLQSVTEGWTALCNVSKTADVLHTAPEMMMQTISAEIDRAVTNAEVRKAYERVGDAPPNERLRIIGAGYRKAGIGSCHLLDFLVRWEAERRCIDKGYGKACLEAAEAFRKPLFEVEERQNIGRYQELACLHGAAPGCLGRAETETGRADVWKARACRRGAKDACRKGDELASYATVLDGQAGKPADTSDIVAAKLELVYAHDVVDCVAEGVKGPDRYGDTVSVDLLVDRHELKVVGATGLPKNVADCAKRSALQWAFDFDHAAQSRYRLEVVVGKKAERVHKQKKMSDEELQAEVTRQVDLLFGESDGSATSDDGVGEDLDKAIEDVRDTGARIAPRGPGTRGPGGSRKPTPAHK